MINLGNLGGTLFFKDIPLFKFKYLNDRLQDSLLLSNKFLPFEFRDELIDDRRLRLFFEARIIPKTRYKIHEDLKSTPIGYYHVERIIRQQNGRTFGDPFYLVCDNDDTCWKE